MIKNKAYITLNTKPMVHFLRLYAFLGTGVILRNHKVP